jgi:hypothetical protein
MLKRLAFFATGPSFVGAVVGLGVAAAVMLTPPIAAAKASYESPYSYDRTWNAALRFLRVDRGFPITEKDDASGYILFDYRAESGARPTPGSLELVRGREEDAPVKVVVQLSQMPHFHEQVLIDELASKMRSDYGTPPPKKKKEPPPPPPEAPDAGPEGGSP